MYKCKNKIDENKIQCLSVEEYVVVIPIWEKYSIHWVNVMLYSLDKLQAFKCQSISFLEISKKNTEICQHLQGGWVEGFFVFDESKGCVLGGNSKPCSFI